jgi:hypothetical protein
MSPRPPVCHRRSHSTGPPGSLGRDSPTTAPFAIAQTGSPLNAGLCPVLRRPLYGGGSYAPARGDHSDPGSQWETHSRSSKRPQHLPPSRPAKVSVPGSRCSPGEQGPGLASAPHSTRANAESRGRSRGGRNNPCSGLVPGSPGREPTEGADRTAVRNMPAPQLATGRSAGPEKQPESGPAKTSEPSLPGRSC